VTGHCRDPWSNARRAVEDALRGLPNNLKLWRMVGEMAVKGVEQRVRARSGGATQAMRDLGVAPAAETAADVQAHPTAATAAPQPHSDAVTTRPLPIAGYDDLSATQVRERLASLDAAGRGTVAEYERSHRGRTTILDAIARLDAQDGRG